MDLLFLKTGMRLSRGRNTEQQNLAAIRDPEGLKVSFFWISWVRFGCVSVLNTSPFLGCI